MTTTRETITTHMTTTRAALDFERIGHWLTRLQQISDAQLRELALVLDAGTEVDALRAACSFVLRLTRPGEYLAAAFERESLDEFVRSTHQLAAVASVLNGQPVETFDGWVLRMINPDGDWLMRAYLLLDRDKPAESSWHEYVASLASEFEHLDATRAFSDDELVEDEDEDEGDRNGVGEDADGNVYAVESTSIA